METRSVWIGDLLVEPSLNRIIGRHQEVQVEPRIMNILLCLIDENGGVVLRDDLIASGWPTGLGTDEGLTKAISTLRSALGDSAQEARFIATIPKRGYRIVAAVNANRVPNEVIVQPGRHPVPPKNRMRPSKPVLFATFLILVSLFGKALIRPNSSSNVPDSMSQDATPISLFADTLNSDEIHRSVDSLISILDLPRNTPIVVRGRVNRASRE